MYRANEERCFGWFVGSLSLEEARIRGAWNFSIHIAAPVSGLLAEPHKKVCRELGYGGDRILAAAALHFKQSIGTDIHRNSDLVRDYSESQEIHNVTLYETDGLSLPIEDDSIDLLYSLTVMQHMETIAVFVANVEEISRCLKPGGLVVMYSGQVSRRSLNRRAACILWWDVLMKETLLTPRFLEKNARVNEPNLVISRRSARAICRSAGLRVIRHGVSGKRVPAGGTNYGSQTLFVLTKEESKGP